ncbi:MAG TPA: bifunctional riboflavin kinase/FAD synthetase [Candidatus Omnitrophota bacterium]|nr:bifunctional riboflavin kinase/FAD synthetase [Candidatus Omnitrophota bacterium]HPD85094.1 bifunctional riboflavin kinase/FAD synthetase [Candidatus Omnitrophota bacterium]HRZ03952.1 bifunctional riboflavin kinase/FAD synthetase [Candidatus Omnitrophota bacterium]
MKVFYRIERLKKKFVRPVLGIGIFDGLHLGHQYLIRSVCQRARQVKGTGILMTFFPHPEHVLKSGTNPPYIISLKHRLKIMQQTGIKACIVVPFTQKFSRISGEDFIKKYLVKMIKAKVVFVGANFKFGKNRSGDARFLEEKGRQHGFGVKVIHSLKKGKMIISSSRIRQFIAAGKIDKAQKLLGRPVSVLGVVVHGDGRGASLGFPTANIESAQDIIVPEGVYAARVTFNSEILKGVASIGRKLSFKGKQVKICIEVHIFNFNKYIYGKEIELMLIRKIRNQKKFASIHRLVSQMRKDAIKAKEFLR